MDHNSCEKDPKFINDALTTLRTLERLSDTMMDNDVAPELVHVMFVAARMVMEQICPREVAKLHPQLQEDEDFNNFIEHVLHSTNTGDKDEDYKEHGNS